MIGAEFSSVHQAGTSDPPSQVSSDINNSEHRPSSPAEREHGTAPDEITADDMVTLRDEYDEKNEGKAHEDRAEAEAAELKTHHSNGLVDQTNYLPPR